MRLDSAEKQFVLTGWLYLVLAYAHDTLFVFVFDKDNQPLGNYEISSSGLSTMF